MDISPSVVNPHIRRASAVLKKNSHEDKVIFDAIQAIESNHPKGRHPANLRHFVIHLDGKPLLLTLVAHLERYGSAYGSGVGKDVGIGSMAAIKKIQATGTRYIIALEKYEFDVISSRWEAAGKQSETETFAQLIHVADHTPLTQGQLDRIYEIAMTAANTQSGLAIYCGKGFGRTGQAAASLLMRSDQMKDGLEKDATESAIVDMYGEKVVAPPLVCRTIKRLRKKDPPHGSDLIAHNGRSSEAGITVETKEQILSLAELEHRLKRVPAEAEHRRYQGSSE